MLSSYTNQVNARLETLFAEHADSDFREALTETITACFHLPNVGLTEEEKALKLLECLFQRTVQFDLSAYLSRFVIQKRIRKRLSVVLLNSLYYGDLKLGSLRPESFLYTLLQITADNISTPVLRSILKKLTLRELICLISYVHQHYREGSYSILKACERLYAKKLQEPLDRLLLGVKSKFLAIPSFPSREIEIEDLKNLVDGLENETPARAEASANTFRALIPLIVDSPVRIIETLEKQMPQGLGVLEETKMRGKAFAEKQREELRVKFNSFYTYPPTNEEFIHFLRLFGIRSGLRPIPYKGVMGRVESLTEKIDGLYEIFRDPLFIMQAEPQALSGFIAFALAIVLHLEALHRKTEKYVTGLVRMTCAIPTYGKQLALQPALPSILKGLSTLIAAINSKLTKKVNLGDYPLFVYDQSDEVLFAKNKREIDALNRRFHSSVIHISTKEVLALAGKLGIDRLIDTTGTVFLGYGGARNCVFLLTPLLKQAFLLGFRTIDEISAMETTALKDLFQTYTLGDISPDTPSGSNILMIDDDMEIPSSNIFSHVFFAEEFWNHYSVSPGYNIGRGTKYCVQFYSLEKLLNNPCRTFTSTEWLSYPFSAGMSEYASKPRFCLNVPFGCEERHLIGRVDINPLLAPSIHMAGTRYPAKEIPTSPFVGLEAYLKDYIPYAMHIAMITSLVDPIDDHASCIFPWNAENLRCSFTSLRAVFTYIASQDVKQQMQSLFRKNFNKIFADQIPEKEEENAHSLRTYLKQLIQTDVHSVIEDYKRGKQLSAKENRSLMKIGTVYKFYRQDAMYLRDFATLLRSNFEGGLENHKGMRLVESVREKIEKTHNMCFTDYPITNGLYLLVKNVGSGEFNVTVDSILH